MGRFSGLRRAAPAARRRQEFFSDGITEELLNLLAQLPGGNGGLAATDRA